MKRFASIILLVLILTGCTAKENNPDQISEVETNTAITTSSAMRVTADETCSATTTESTTTTTAETDSCNYVEVSDGNEFIDFDYIEDYKGITNQAEVEKATDAAMKVLKGSSYYADTMKNIDEFDPDTLEGYLDNDGNIIPTFNQAFVEDFDGNGIKETFLLLDMPYKYNKNTYLIRSFLVFINSDNRAEFLNDYYDIVKVSMLNYGINKQLIITSSGCCGADEQSSLYGVKSSNAIQYYNSRVSYKKDDCFLSCFGWQASGDFMYFDTVALEYRAIVGEELDIDEVLSMDKTNSLDDLNLDLSSEWCGVYYISKNYYCFSRGMMDSGVVYTYENGKFTLSENSGIRISENFFGMNAVKNIDIDKAVAEMKKPEK